MMSLLWLVACSFPAVFCIPSYSCSNDFNDFCTFSNVNPEPNKKFYLTTSIKAPLQKIQFNASRLASFDSTLCDTFTNVWDLRIWMLDIEVILDHALRSCKRLKIVNFYKNKLSIVDKTLLVDNPELTMAIFTDNQIEVVHPEAFKNNPKLEHLWLDSNSLKEFQISTSLPALVELNLNSNSLLDLDIDRVLSRLSNLNKLSIGDNDFQCERMKQIVDAPKGKVQLEKGPNVKLRKVKPSDYLGYSCYNKDQMGDISLELINSLVIRLTYTRVQQLQNQVTSAQVGENMASLNKANLISFIIICVVFLAMAAVPAIIFFIYLRLKERMEAYENRVKRFFDEDYYEVVQ